MTDERGIYHAEAKPIKVGILSDMGPWLDEPAMEVFRMAADEMEASSRIERPIKLIQESVSGAPTGYILDVIPAFEKLVDEGCLVICGINHSDNCKGMAEIIDACRVPTITLGAASEHLGEYAFSVQWGSIPEDAHLIANWLHQKGCKRIAVAWDFAYHCGEYMSHLRAACKLGNVEILGDKRISQVKGPQQDVQAREGMAYLRSLEPDALVCLSTSSPGVAWVREVFEGKWDIPRIMNGGFYGAYAPDTRALYEGWVGTGLPDPENATLSAFNARFRERFGKDPMPEMSGLYYDGIRAALEGVAMAPILTPEGVKLGLEQVKLLPACTGGPRSVISFGPWDRRGISGMDPMVLRQVKDGEVGFAGRFDPAVDPRYNAPNNS